DVYMPAGKGPFPGVVAVHGGEWINDSRNEWKVMSTALAKGGVVVYAVDYRMPCNPNHVEAGIDPKLCGYTFPKPTNDIGDAVAWVRRHGGTYNTITQRVGVLGSS